MANDFSSITDQPSGFELLLRYLGRPAYSIRNLLKGNVEGAVRQGADILGDTVDAFLPGDVVPEFSRKDQDYTEASDLIGGLEPGLLKTGVDILGGVATDPLTYTGLGLFTKPLAAANTTARNLIKAAPAGAQLLGKADQAAEGLGTWLRSATGNQRLTPLAQDALQAQASASALGAATGFEGARKAFDGLTPDDLQSLTKVMQGVTRSSEDAAYQAIIPSEANTPAAKLTGDVLDKLKPFKPAGIPPSITGKADLTDLLQKNADLIPDQGFNRDSLSTMLGSQDLAAAKPSGTDLVSNLGDAAMYAGGMSKKAPEFRSVAPEDVSRALFTNKGSQEDVLSTLGKRIDALNLPADQAERLRSALPDYIDLKRNQFADRINKGVMEKPAGSDLEKDFSTYMPRMYIEDLEGQGFARNGVTPNTAKARSLNTPEDVANHLNVSGKELETDAAKAEGTYAQQQGSLLGKAALANKIIDDVASKAETKISDASKSVENWTALPLDERYKLAGLTPAEQLAHEAKGSSLYTLDGSGKLKTATDAVLNEMAQADPASRESAQVLMDAFNGLPPRAGFFKALASVNSIFKPYATAGAFIPRINFTTRNLTGGIFQVLSNPDARAQWPKYAKEAGSMLLGAVDDGIEKLTGKRIGEDQFQAMNDAIANSGGNIDKAVNALPEGPMREALRTGVVTDTFADSELLSKEIARTGWGKRFRDIRDWPASIAQGSEKRMRYSTFEGLLDSGVPPDEAAKIVKDTFFDYSMSSQANRAARDIIPFFAFTAKAVPQTVKALKEFPFLIPATRPLFTSDPNNIVPGYLQSQMRIPIGDNADGQPTYITSLGLPIESLNQIPNPSDSLANFGRQVRQDLVGGSNPAIKTAYGVVTGTDPYFGTNFMSYDKAPAIATALGADERSGAARIYNALQGTGVIQPIASPINVLNSLVDPKKSGLESLINTATGAQVKNVDEQRALRGLIEDYLKSNPDVSRSESFFQYSPDQGTQDAIKQLSQIKAKMAKDRKSQQQLLP